MHTVRHQHCNRHRSDSAGNRSNSAAMGRCILIIHIPAKLSVLHPVDPNIDYHRSLLNIGAVDQFRLSDGNDQNIRSFADLFQIFRFRMADRNGSVLSKHQHCHGLAYDIASPNDNTFLSSDLYSRALQKLNNSRRRTGNKALLSDGKSPYVHRMEPVYILLRRNPKAVYLEIKHE